MKISKTTIYNRILEYFREQGEFDTELEYGSVFQFLIAVVLSAQCTDKRVNMITQELFSAYPDAKSMADADEAEVYEYVKSVSYPNAKAKHIVELSRMIMAQFGGEVPFGRNAMPVDTHVYRVSHRLGLVSKTSNTPLKVEKELCKHIPHDEWGKAHHWLLLHGRYVCKSNKPLCQKCPFSSFCPKKFADSKL